MVRPLGELKAVLLTFSSYKPNCLLSSKFCVTTWLVISLAMQDSINLLGILSLDSSLYHVMSSSRPFLNTALTLAIFHWSGGLKASTLCLNKLARDGAIDIPAYFKWRADTLSGPAAFFTFNLKIFPSISIWLIVMLVVVGMSTFWRLWECNGWISSAGPINFSATYMCRNNRLT